MKTISLFAILLIGSLAGAHSRLKASDVIKIRSTDPGVKTAPCGGFARVAQAAAISGGQSITVTWEETIYHPGRFEFYFSPAGDANFTFLKSVENTQAAAALPHQYSTTLTIPNVNCDKCTFQMVQVMAENPAAPTYYYSCSDMQVTANGSGTPTPLPVASPTPLPGTTDNCH